MIARNKVFKPLYTGKTRYYLLTGGRGGAKSFEAATFLCLLSYEDKQRIIFTRYTMTSAEKSIIPEFVEKIEGLEASESFTINQTEIVNLRSNSKISFMGLKTSSGLQTGNLKSLTSASTWCNDESEELVDEELFDKIDLSIRTQNAVNRVILIMNPSDKSHFVYKKWIQNTHKIVMVDGYPVEISTHPDVTHIHTTYLDNRRHLDDSFLNIVETMKKSNASEYAHKIIGQWQDVKEGTIFNKQELKTYKPVETYDHSFAYVDVADEGNDYLCMMVGCVVGRQIHIVDIVFSQQNTDITLPLCVEVLKRNKVTECRVESNSMGAMFKRNLERELKDCRVWGASSTTNKFARILNDSAFILSNFYFKPQNERNAMYEQALNQMSQFTRDGKAKHDDVADAASGLAIWVRACLPHLYV